MIVESSPVEIRNSFQSCPDDPERWHRGSLDEDGGLAKRCSGGPKNSRTVEAYSSCALIGQLSAYSNRSFGDNVPTAWLCDNNGAVNKGNDYFYHDKTAAFNAPTT